MSMTLANLRLYVQAHGWNDVSVQGLLDEVTFVNETLTWLSQARNWPHLIKQASVVLAAPYATGTASVVKAATAVTGAGTAFAAGMVGQSMVFDDDADRAYMIASVTTGTALVLADAFAGTTISGGAYAIYYVRYAAPSDFGRVGNLYVERANGAPSIVTLDEWLEAQVALPGHSASVPTLLAPVRSESSGSANYFYVHPAPSETKQIRYTYYRLPTVFSGASESATADWPDRLMPLYQTALRKRMALDDRSLQGFVLLDQQMEKDLAVAYHAERPSILPIVAGRRRGRGLTVEERQARIKLT